MNRPWLRITVVLALWLIGSLALFQATLRFPTFYESAWFYVACAACGALGLFMGKVDRVASLMAVPVLAVASFAFIGIVRLSYFGL